MTKARKIIEAGRILITQGECRPLKFIMHTCAERKMLPYRQPARGAAARSASLEKSVLRAKRFDMVEDAASC